MDIVNQLGENNVMVIYLFCLSFFLRTLLILIGQNWVKTISHTATLIALPMITFVITRVISGNIALSLGMVGALSIVRFRNPVKSPFELVAYFSAITMGIAASVSWYWAHFLVGSIIFSIVSIILLNKLYKVFFSKSLFEPSFTEGNQLSTLEVQSKEIVSFLQESDLLISEAFSDNQYRYILTSNKFDELKHIALKLKNFEGLISMNVNR